MVYSSRPARNSSAPNGVAGAEFLAIVEAAAAAAFEASGWLGPAEAAFAVIGLAGQDSGRGFVDFLDADGHEAEDVFVEAELTLHFGDEGWLGVEAEQHVVALAVLLDPVGQAAQTPVFALLDRAAIGFQFGANVVGDLLDLLLRDVVPCDEHGFIKRHG